MRWPHGFVCRCGDRQAWFLKSRAMYECLGCRRQTSIKAGTAMQGSRLPLTVWFCAAHILAASADPVPVRQFQDLLGISYKAAWGLRRTLLSLTEVEQEVEGGEAPETLDDVEGLEGLVEVNRTELPSRGYDPVTRRSQLRKVVVAVALERAPLEDDTPFPHGRIRLATIEDSSAASMEVFVRTNVTRGATLLTDGHKSYLGLRGYQFDPRAHGKRLPRTEQVFVSMKNWFKADNLDREAVDRGLQHFRAQLVPETPRSNQRVTFETLLRLVLQHEPNSNGVSTTKTSGKGIPMARRKPQQRNAATRTREGGSRPG
jgi:ISXO2-like transposase domain